MKKTMTLFAAATILPLLAASLGLLLLTLFPALGGDAYPARRFVTYYNYFSYTVFFILYLAWLSYLFCRLIASTDGPILCLDKHTFGTAYARLKGNVATVVLFVGYTALLYLNTNYYYGEIMGWYAEVHTEELLDNFRLNLAFVAETMLRNDFRFFPLAHQDLHLLSWFTPYVKIWILVSALELFVIVYFAKRLVADLLGHHVPGLLLLAALLFLLHPSTANAFFQLIYAERLLVLFFSLFLYSYHRYLTSKAETYFYLTLVCASLGIFFKDTAFILFTGPPFFLACSGIASRYVRDFSGQPLRAKLKHLFQTHRLESILVALCFVYLILYLILSLVPSMAGGAGAYNDDRERLLMSIDEGDIRTWLILVVVGVRAVSIIAGKARANILDSVNASALVYVLALDVLIGFESYDYRVLPVYFVALLNILYFFGAAYNFSSNNLRKPALGVIAIVLCSLGLLGYEYREGSRFTDTIDRFRRVQTSWRDTLVTAKSFMAQKLEAGEEVNLIYTTSWFDDERYLNRLRYQRLIYLEPDDHSYLVKDGAGRGRAYTPKRGDILINIDRRDLDFLGDELSKYELIYESEAGRGNGQLFAYR